jgi:lysophospholipase L1-like esterase
MKRKSNSSRAPSHAPVSLFETLESRTLLAAVKIMPLGDSITESASGHASYRYWLWNTLVSAGYDVDFVGSMTGVAGGAPLYSNFDQNHEGHSGYRADQIQSNIVSWANLNKPDVVLLHIGTNDILGGQTNSSTISEVGGIIDNLRSVNPNVKILLAEIIPNTSSPTTTQQFDSLIPGLASSKSTAQSPVIVVDQWSGFNANTDTYDGIHPTQTGEQKMSAKWYSALQGVLPAPVPLPAGTYLSDLNWSSMSNGWGSAEKDMSNGETGTGDGKLITLNGVSYRKGLGVHSASDVRYNIAGGNYNEFRADIGVDDEVGNAGSVVFQVYVDNVLKYTSPKMTGTSSTIPISVAIPAGASTLRLVVTDSGDGNAYDHADWAYARLLQGAPVPAPNAPTGLNAVLNGSKIDLTWTDASTDELGFRIERKTGVGGTYAQIADLGAGITSSSDTNVTAGNTYYYRVLAYNSGGVSAYSNESSVTIAAPPPPTGTQYLSDLAYVVNSNGWGPAEKDKSNGESSAGDGRTITLNGKTYAKGIGAHAASEIVYNLNGQYAQFLSDIGVDDEVGNNGSVVFQVYLDNVKVYDSGKMTGSTATKSINLTNLAGKTQLKLVVTNSNDGNAYDHADWAGAQLVAGAPLTPPSAASDLSANLNGAKVDLAWTDGSTNESGFRIQRKLGTNGAWGDVTTVGANITTYSDTSVLAANSTYYYQVIAFNSGGSASPSNSASITTPAAPAQVWLSDLAWVGTPTNGWGSVEKDHSNGEAGANDGNAISLRGTTYTKGLGAHSFSQITYNLAGSYKTFQSDIGVDDETGGNGSVVFQILVDGVLKYDSGTVRGTDAIKSINLDITAAQQITLLVQNAGDGYDFDHADWAGAKLLS